MAFTNYKELKRHGICTCTYKVLGVGTKDTENVNKTYVWWRFETYLGYLFVDSFFVSCIFLQSMKLFLKLFLFHVCFYNQRNLQSMKLSIIDEFDKIMNCIVTKNSLIIWISTPFHRPLIKINSYGMERLLGVCTFYYL